jgi:hypothetical protein
MTQENKSELSPQDINSLREALYWSKDSYIEKARKYAFGEKMGDGYYQKIDGYYENDYLPKLKWFDEIDIKLKRLSK